MIQVCEPPRVPAVRRFSAEEFCFLLRGEAGSLYRPRSEVLRMLTVGEVCGVCDAAGAPAGAVLLQPLNADTALAAALRAWAGWRGVEGGQFLTPPVLHQPDAAEPLLRAAFARAERLARGGRVLAVLECTAQSDALLPLYIRAGAGAAGPAPAEQSGTLLCAGRRVRGPGPGAVWVPLQDRARLAVCWQAGMRHWTADRPPGRRPCWLCTRHNNESVKKRGRTMKAVILESYVMEPGDLDWSGVKALVPDTVSYVRTAYEEIAPRIGDADLVLLNKCRIDENILAQCPNLKWVGIIATGTDNLDLEACAAMAWPWPTCRATPPTVWRR